MSCRNFAVRSTVFYSTSTISELNTFPQKTWRNSGDNWRLMCRSRNVLAVAGRASSPRKSGKILLRVALGSNWPSVCLVFVWISHLNEMTFDVWTFNVTASFGIFGCTAPVNVAQATQGRWTRFWRTTGRGSGTRRRWWVTSEVLVTHYDISRVSKFFRGFSRREKFDSVSPIVHFCYTSHLRTKMRFRTNYERFLQSLNTNLSSG